MSAQRGRRALAAHWEDAGRALAVARRRPSLARAELAYGLVCVAEWAFTVGLGIVAYQDGGAARVGLVSALRLLPSAALAPVAASFADRWPRERVLIASSVVTAVALGGGVPVLATDGPRWIFYVLVAVATVALTPYRAAHSALLPSLSHTTDELAAAHIVRGLLESLSVVIGPLAASALVELTELWTVFAAAAAFAAVATVLLVRLPYERPPMLGAAERAGLAAEVVDGLRATVTNRDASTLMLLASAQTFLRGGLNVFSVVLAIEVLEIGDGGVGLLQAAVGVGAVLGSLGAARLVGARRMAAWFGAAVAMWGIPMCLMGAVPRTVPIVALLALIGVANAVLDVGLFTMLGRLVPDAVLARVFGVFESLVSVTVALGAVVAAVAIDLVGIRVAMVAIGAVAPVAVIVGRSRLVRIDHLLAARQGELAVLREVPMLRTLPVPVIEHLARHLVRREAEPGEVVLREGTVGTRFYVIAAGEVEVLERGRLIRSMGPGEGFGEISLLRTGRRTTTVRASSPVTLYAIDRDDFVGAVSGVRSAAAAADATIEAWQRP